VFRTGADQGQILMPSKAMGSGVNIKDNDIFGTQASGSTPEAC